MSPVSGTFQDARMRGAVRAALDEVREDYLGCLIPDKASHFEDFGLWLDMLHTHHRPVVHLVTEGAPQSTGRRAGEYYRCRIARDSALECALAHLADRGHTRVGYMQDTHERWRARRGEALAAMAPEHGIDLIRLSPDSSPPAPWMADHRPALEDALDDRDMTDGHIGRDVRLLLAYLLQDVTALILPNDRLIQLTTSRLEALRSVIPHSPSLISFDNLPVSRQYQTTTVDFGFAGLAYKAFHLILKDIPVRSNRYGDVFSEPFVVDRGSVGTATR
jgi:DNA-binding LacI/PurR family transcriptional regulator